MLSEEIMNDMAYVFPLPLIVINQRKNVVFANQQAEFIFQKSAYKLTQMGFEELFNLDARMHKIFHDVLSEKKNSTIHNVDIISRNSISLKKLSMNVFTLGKSSSYFMLQLSVVEATDETHKTLKNHGVNESLFFLSRMFGKEVKNPLSSILGATQILEYHDNNPETIEMTEIIKSESKKILKLVQSIDEVSFYLEGKNTVVNMHEILQEAKQNVQNRISDNVTIKELYDPSLPEIWGNKEQLIQLFSHLIDNAVEAIAQKKDGYVVLKSQFSQRKLSSTSYNDHHKIIQDNLNLIFSVEDNGGGIDDAFLSQLFLPFATTRQNKQGLGLSKALAIAHNHNGMIMYEKHFDMTCFRVSFPSYTNQYLSRDGSL